MQESQFPSPSLTVRRPQVQVVLESTTGLERHVEDVIGTEFDKLMELRLAVKTSIKQGEPRYLCAECFTPVYLCRRRVTQHFFFRHTVEDGRCTAITRGQLSQDEIKARKYNGAKESLLHRQIKQWLDESLRASGRFLDIAQEERWTGRVKGEWRKPDVTATLGELKIAFEVQLSTTFLDVIAERRLFYLKEGGLLFWVFARFDDDGRRLTMDDVFYNNNQNAFVISEETRDASRTAGDFLIDCIWTPPPSADSHEPRFHLLRERVSFDQLSFDTQKQQAFYFDYASARSQVLAAEAADRASWPAQFEEWWLEVADRYPSLYDQMNELRFFPENVPRHWGNGQMLTDTPLRFYGKELRLPVAMLDAFYSAKHGRPIGIQRKQFIEVAHYLVQTSPRYLPWFRKALMVYDRGSLLKDQDKSGKWARRVKAYKADMRVAPDDYAPDQTHQRLFEYLFPELCPLPEFAQSVL